MGVVAFTWFIIGVGIVGFTAIFISLRRALLFAMIWVMPIAASSWWKAITTQSTHVRGR